MLFNNESLEMLRTFSTRSSIPRLLSVGDQNRMKEARNEYEEALKIYEAFAKQDPEQFTTDVKRLEKVLQELPK